MIGGISICPNTPIGRVVEVVRHAEQLGYSRCWVNDEGLGARDVFVVLTAIAQRTERIKIGTGVTNPYTRHPAVTVASIAAVDELSGGRAFLGIGAGGTYTLDPLGIARRRPLTAVREMVTLTRRLFHGETVTYQGETVRLNTASLYPCRPDLEIWIAGRGPKMTALAGEIADGFAVGALHEDVLRAVVEGVRQKGRESGRKPRICYSSFLVMNEGMMSNVRPLLAYSLIDTPPGVRRKLGISDGQIAELRRAILEGGLDQAGRLIYPQWIEPYVVKGSAAECATRLTRRMQDCGIDEFMLPILDWTTAVDVMTQIAQALSLTWS